MLPERRDELKRLLHALLTEDPESRRRRFEELESQDAAAAELLRLAVDAAVSADADATLRYGESGRSSHPDGSSTNEDEHLGAYRILRELGRGGQGTVYLAEDTRLRRQVALKLLSGRGTVSLEGQRRFKREAELASKLVHPGICTIYEAGVHQGIAYIAMQVIEGESLAAKLSTARGVGNQSVDPRTSRDETGGSLADDVGSDGRRFESPSTFLEIAAVLELIEKAARSLHAAHEAGVLHRDIKPGNIMVTPNGDPVILDFGLARELDRESSILTQTGDLLGTPAYVSPEQLLVKRVSLDARTDIYSLGVTLFECLTLRRPFDAPTREGLYYAINFQEPPDIRILNPALSRDLAIVTATALERNRDRRYQTALAFAEDLRRVRLREPILARPVGRITKLVRWAEREPLVAAMLVAVFLSLGGGLVATLLQKGRADLAAAEAERNLAAFGRLADARKLDDLLEQSERLWPADKRTIAAMQEWLREARGLVERLPDHEAALERLRSEAGPWTEEEQRRDRESYRAELQSMASARELEASILADLQALNGPAPTVDGLIDQRTAALEARLKECREFLVNEESRLAPLLCQRRSYAIADPALAWLETKTADLVQRLQEFALDDPRRPGLAAVEGRLATALALDTESVSACREEWDRCLARLAVKPKPLGDLIREPIAGLVPLGPDPQTCFEEFSALSTGARPIRDSASGVLLNTEASAIVFVLLPGGRVRLGAQNFDSKGHNYDTEATATEQLPKEETVAPFLVSKYEMTQGQWLRLTGLNPSGYAPDADKDVRVRIDLKHPVESISFRDCVTTLWKFSMRLPSEPEWEYACRAGADSPWSFGGRDENPWLFCNVADQSLRNAGGETPVETWDDRSPVHASVDAYAPNAFGLHGMHGNVFEWCQGWYSPKWRLLRGGSYMRRLTQSRSAARSFGLESTQDLDIGVRPVFVLPPAEAK